MLASCGEITVTNATQRIHYCVAILGEPLRACIGSQVVNGPMRKPALSVT